MQISRITRGCGLCLAALIGLVSGCSSAIVGSYDGGAAPAESKFHISRATFKKDNTFTAFVKEGEEDGRILNGTYEFDGFTLKIKQAGKKERKYSATFNSFTKALDISTGGASQSLKKM